MTPTHEGERYRLYCGDCLEVLPMLEAGKYHTCVTSPPYYGLRSYLPNAVQIKSNLTAEQKQEVLNELAKLGINPKNPDWSF